MSLKKILYHLKEQTLNLLYPHCCPVCHDILADQNTLICPECLSGLRPIREPFCKKCGRPVKEGAEYCKDCEKVPRFFTEGRAVYPYDQVLRESILRFKYAGRREYSAFYASAIRFYLADSIRRWRPDVIIPVPMYRKKERQRGFNQAAEIAELLGAQTGIAVDKKSVQKIRSTSSQKKLSEKDRRKNLLDAFAVTGNVRGKRVLILDDVFTTGATADALAAALLSAGAHTVCFVTVCIAINE